MIIQPLRPRLGDVWPLIFNLIGGGLTGAVVAQAHFLGGSTTPFRVIAGTALSCATTNYLERRNYSYRVNWPILLGASFAAIVLGASIASLVVL